MVVFAVGGAGDRRRRVGEFLLCSDTWELLYIMRDDLSLYSRGIIHNTYDTYLEEIQVFCSI